MRVAILLPAILFSAIPAAEPASSFQFEDVTEKAGLKDPLAGLMGHGGAWGDYDGDGRPDCFVGGFCDRPAAEYKPAAGPVASALFRNRGDGTFEHIRTSPATTFARTSGAVFADLDNDGRPELYIANNAKPKGRKADEPQASALARHSLLLRNTGGAFTDISQDSGACPASLFTARNVLPFDYDLDGDLDLLVVEDKFTRQPRTALFRNVGGLRFQDVTKEAGLPENLFALGAAVADVNEDGRPDLFLPHSNRLFLSAKDGTFREPAELRDTFAWKPLDGEDWPCGAHFADLNADGRFDLVLSIHGVKARNQVWLNEGVKDGVPRFRNITREAALGDIVPVRCPHVEVQDFDNDGRPDIYFSAAKLEKGRVTPLIFRNLGVRGGIPRFEPNFGVNEANAYFPAGPTADFDGDGRLDLLLVNWFAGNHTRLLRNVASPRNWLDVRVVGKTVNRDGIGSRIEVRSGDKLLGVQEIATGFGYASGQMPIAHFGLEDVAAVDVTILLPGGTKPILRRDVRANQLLIVNE